MSRKARKTAEISSKNLLKKSLDSLRTCAYSPAPVAIVTAVVTGVGDRQIGVETLQSEDSDKRQTSLPLTPRPRPKGLRREDADGRFPSCADKNALALRRND